MIPGIIEQLVFFHPDSHMICSNIGIQLLNNNCLNISRLVYNESKSKHSSIKVSSIISTMFYTAGVLLI